MVEVDPHMKTGGEQITYKNKSKAGSIDNNCKGRTRVIVESLTAPVRFDTISEQKRDETNPTRPLTASESNFWSKRYATGTHLLAFRFQLMFLCDPDASPKSKGLM